MPLSEAQKRSNIKHDKEHWQYITFKAHVGSKGRIAEAAEAAGQSVNGFIRAAVSKAVMDVLSIPMEPDKHADRIPLDIDPEYKDSLRLKTKKAPKRFKSESALAKKLREEDSKNSDEYTQK